MPLQSGLSSSRPQGRSRERGRRRCPLRLPRGLGATASHPSWPRITRRHERRGRLMLPRRRCQDRAGYPRRRPSAGSKSTDGHRHVYDDRRRPPASKLPEPERKFWVGGPIREPTVHRPRRFCGRPRSWRFSHRPSPRRPHDEGQEITRTLSARVRSSSSLCVPVPDRNRRARGGRAATVRSTAKLVPARDGPTPFAISPRRTVAEPRCRLPGRSVRNSDRGVSQSGPECGPQVSGFAPLAVVQPSSSNGTDFARHDVLVMSASFFSKHDVLPGEPRPLGSSGH
jgi:hypothetical protein